MKPLLTAHETRTLLEVKKGEELTPGLILLLEKLPIKFDYSEVITADRVHWLAEHFGMPKKYLDSEIYVGSSALSMRQLVRMSEEDLPTREFHWTLTDMGVLWEDYDRIEAYTTWEHSPVDDSVIKIYASRFNIIGNTKRASITNQLLQAYKVGKETNDDYEYISYDPEERLLTIWGCQFRVGAREVYADFWDLERLTFDDTFLVDGITDVPIPGHIVCYVEGLDNDSEW